MGQHQLLHTGCQGCLGRHGARGVLFQDGHLRFSMGKSSFVDQKVCPAGQFDRRFAEDGVGAVHQTATWARRAAQPLPVDHPTVLQGHSPSCFEFGVDRTGGNSQFLGQVHVETSWQRFLVNSVGVGGDPMVEGRAAHAQVPIVQQDFTAVGGLADPVAPEGIANAGGGCPQDPFQVIAQRIGSVEIDPGAAARQPQAGQQPRQAKDMVSMHVGDEDSPQLGDPEVTAQKLVLGALTTVK